MRQCLLFSFAASAAAHGDMTLPASRNGGNLTEAGGHLGIPQNWYTDGVTIAGAATLPKELHTITWDTNNPWRAPGTVPVDSPCGQLLFGGAPKCPGHDWPCGKDGLDLPKTGRTVWQQGGTADVAWAIYFNHGGGYAYRLCPASQKQTESCFQEHHLEFADDVHTIHWSSGKEVTIPAKRTKTGTYPAGSHWSMNPIPTTEGGLPAPFGPPCTGCQGDKNPFSIKDQVKVPMGLAPGNYTLSWRWDCDVTKQVWLNCADITIVGASPTPPSPAPASTAYKCFDNGCLPAAGGVAKETCEQACAKGFPLV